MEITPYINKNNKEPIYSQIYSYVKREIESGRLSSGSKLPSIRQLSQYLKVSKNTIEEAYHQLIAEGYAESRPKSGIFVSPVEDIINPKQPLTLEPMKYSIELTKKTFKYDFQYGDIDITGFPMKKWRKHLNEALDLMDSDSFNYGDKQGDAELRKQIALYLYRSRGVTCNQEQIVITSGTQQSISLLIKLLSLREEMIGFEDPGYDGVRSIFSHENCKISPIPLQHDGMDIASLVNGTRAVYVTPSHQFPMGMILSIQKRKKLLNWAYQTGGYIIEDDYDGEFRYQGMPIPPLKALDEGEKVIYLGTFSKCFLPSARLSYMVLPPELSLKCKKEEQLPHQNVSTIIQKAASSFMATGEFESHIRKMRKIYHGKHRTLLSSIENYMGNKVEVIGEKAGLHILLKVKNRKDFELIEAAGLKGVKVYSASAYLVNDVINKDATIMLGFGGLSEDDIESGIRLLHEAWFI
ncbi:PLP-dependent aminotransferase family protein [Bacillus sp. ISL-47]|uniref:MocR-like pyridoxine biosynthesis transcription factor PdxR n=1 Tax=Bacillus sp. ISL-47 TaxID=2819130 RepID=UPI001BEB1093|nr:PLP-dependent aminotransferase family protein [Bacillus sp. ISL-47]MBT2688170.1 PLP-dependent aminotransferase family protein [Bacillus sp. ISL-47]MBT2708456.1 PLP-dependent aminotransferase family protein [Pseudomonas sp. ISL-84]